jgi:hypothetical protein
MSVMLSRKKKIFYYLTKRYAHPVVVFDGYSSGPSIKDHTHSRRTKGIEGTTIEFRKNTPFKSEKDNFLCNNENKRAFINMLSAFLVGNGIQGLNMLKLMLRRVFEKKL